MTTITALPTPPNRSMVQSVFTTTADAFLAALPGFVTQTNTVASEVNGNAAAAATSAANAATSATTATTAAATATNAANVNGTSTTSTTPVLGTMTFTYVEAARAVVVGQRIRAASRGTAGVYASGTVTGWNSGTQAVTLNVDNIGSAVVAADWNLMLEGSPGVGATLKPTPQTFGATGTLVASYAGATVTVSATSSLTLDKAASLGAGWSVFFPAQAFAITLNTSSGTELIAQFGVTSAITMSVPIGKAAMLTCTGAGFILTLVGQVDSEVTVGTGNSAGSTNTAIPRFSVIRKNTGTDITYTDSATLGASFTINTPGLYSVHGCITSLSNSSAGASLNTTQPSTALTSLTNPAEVICWSGAVSTQSATFSGVIRCVAGDIIRPHHSTVNSTSTATQQFFSIKKIG